MLSSKTLRVLQVVRVIRCFQLGAEEDGGVVAS